MTTIKEQLDAKAPDTAAGIAAKVEANIIEEGINPAKSGCPDKLECDAYSKLSPGDKCPVSGCETQKPRASLRV